MKTRGWVGGLRGAVVGLSLLLAGAAVAAPV